MNRDRIERALREPGPREREYSPEALPASAAEMRARAPRRRGLLMSAGAVGGLVATVAAGVVVAVVLVRSFGGGGNTGGPASSATPVPTASTTPLAACRAADFAWSADPWGGAMGSRGTIILARAVATLDRCELKGDASLSLLDANGSLVVSGKTAPTKLTVSGGQTFQVGVTWSNWCGADPTQPFSLQLTLPEDSNPVPLVPAVDQGLTFNTCNGPGQGSTLSGTDFQPSDRAPQG